MGKDPKVRWDATIKYLNDHFDHLGDHINGVVKDDKTRKAISEELSLGDRKDKSSDKTYAANTNQRHALRGLFLCQRVYYSPLWAGRTWDLKTFKQDEVSLVKDWKTKSLAFWKAKNEHDVLEGIGMFMPKKGATAADLARVAAVDKPNGTEVLPGNLTLSRADTKARGAAETCYNGVVSWLLLSGIVSMRWLMRDTAPNGETACNRLFGKGKLVWDGTPITNAKEEKEAKAKLKLKPGFIYHLWMEESGLGGWNGHWVVCNADGKTISGVNNGENEEHDVRKPYTNHSPFFVQFEGYYGELKKQTGPGVYESFNPKKYPTPYVAEFDPLALAERM